MNQSELNFVDVTNKEQQFLKWKGTPGARFILEGCHRVSCYFGRRFLRTGRRVSMKLIWELQRDRLDGIRKKAADRGEKLTSFQGYAMNNILTPYVADHIIARHPTWKGMFESRARDTKPRKVFVVAVKERKTA